LRLRGSATQKPSRALISSNILKSRRLWLLTVLAILLIVGLVTFRDFGTSVDEGIDSAYGSLFLHFYETGTFLKLPGTDYLHDYFHGPFYFMVFTITTRVFRFLGIAPRLTDGLHLTNYLSFLVGLFFLYRLCLRMVPRGVSLLATALFALQPVLFGHAFINQKDIPLMVFILASVELGWAAVDRLAGRWSSIGASSAPQRRDLGGLNGGWQSGPRSRRGLFVLLLIIVVLALLDVWLFRTGEKLAKGLLAEVYRGKAPSLVVALFHRIAQDAYKTPLEAYLAKLDRILSLSRIPFTAILLAFGLAIWRWIFPDGYRRSMGAWLRTWGPLFVAGAVLGLTNSIRVIAPFSGLLVGIYAVARLRRHVFVPLGVYTGAAAVVSFLSWPLLWANPLAPILEPFLHVSHYDAHEVLFLGTIYRADSLPWFYVPLLMGVQFTLPAIALFLLGAPSSLSLSSGTAHRRLPVALTWLWILLPFLAGVFRLVPTYNNFRHFFFMLPAMFVIVGFGMWRTGTLVRSPAVRGGLAVLALVPGLVGIVRLHPYEYIYYNDLVGGVRGADGEFETDYWCTAFRRAMEYVNIAAGPNSRIGVYRGVTSAAPYARSDLHLYRLADRRDSSPAYAVFGCRQALAQASLFPEMQPFGEVRVEGVVLAIVTKRSDTR
jgi:hypothetical protein